jgi:hypothetical protein
MSLKKSLIGSSSRGRTTLGIAALAASLALLLVLKALPYSTMILEPVAEDEARKRPGPDFSLGSVTWTVTAYAELKELRPFRDKMRASCGTARGLEAATCGTRQLQVSAFGSPATEFVNADFDPVAHLERHLNGAPGHCLTRSAILAAELLATGTPARVVQMVSAHERGHTLVEVWDETLGWTVVDPTAGGYITGVTEHASAADLLADPHSVDWKAFGVQPPPAELEAKRQHFQRLLAGNLLYPEPWLYLRVGKRIAPRPWRGSYARVGPSFAALGPAQRVLSWSIPGLALAGLALLASSWRRVSAVEVGREVQPQGQARPASYASAHANRRAGLLDADY